MKKLTAQEFIARAKEVHGSKYDYSKVDFVNVDTKVCIICPEHGEFWQTPYKHMKGNGCPFCKGKFPKKEKERQFIETAKKIHNNKYDYSKVSYENGHKKVCIICPEHGEFWQTPLNHLNGEKCPKCAKRYMDTEYFIKKAKEIHGSKYDYSKVNYINSDTKVCIICPEHGEFWQSPSSHLNGNGCPYCGGTKRLSTAEFIDRARKVHGDKYDYSKAEYKNRVTPITITCSIHGDFSQKPSEHLNGNGCPLCALEARSDNRRRGFESFMNEAMMVHDSKYEYDEGTFSIMRNKVKIICPEHGEFWQEADSHIRGNGCPICSHSVSHGENEIYSFLKEHLNTEVLQRVRNIIPPQEIDIYLPELKIGIEYNGNIWHSEKFSKNKEYHYNKMINCEKKGIRLLQIFEDEYILHPDIVKSKIMHIINKDNNESRIYGRKCTVKEISQKTAKEFLLKNHIQGYGASSIYIGAFFGNEIVGVMTFKRLSDEKWELTRCATKVGYSCIGVSGKMFHHFVKTFSPEIIKSFADRRWTSLTDNLYLKLGFYEDKILPPDYRYIMPDKINRIHKFNFRKQFLSKKYGFSVNLTEKEMAEELRAYKIWDCGLIRYVWNNKK